MIINSIFLSIDSKEINKKENVVYCILLSQGEPGDEGGPGFAGIPGAPGLPGRDGEKVRY